MTPGGMLWNDSVLFTHTVTRTSSPATTSAETSAANGV